MDIRLVRFADDNYFKLILNKDDKITMGEKPICQSCKGPISVPFYVCEKTKKWFCTECEHKTINGKEEKVENLICKLYLQDNHKHICIHKVVEYDAK